MKYKTGDKVLVKDGSKGECGALSDIEFDYLVITDVSEAWYSYDAIYKGKKVGSCCVCYKDKDITPYSTVNKSTDKPTNFILQYELDRDPFETFATMREVEARIKELAKDATLKRESIKVYEIAKTYDVKLETRVIFGGVKVKMSEAKKPKKRKYKHSAAFLAKKAALAA